MLPDGSSHHPEGYSSYCTMYQHLVTLLSMVLKTPTMRCLPYDTDDSAERALYEQMSCMKLEITEGISRYMMEPNNQNGKTEGDTNVWYNIEALPRSIKNVASYSWKHIIQFVDQKKTNNGDQAGKGKAKDTEKKTAKKLPKGGHSIKVEVEGQHYSLKREPFLESELEEYPDIPDDLVNGIAEICEETKVDDPELHRHPNDPYVLILEGIGADKASKKVQQFSKSCKFSVITKNLNSFIGRIVELAEDCCKTFTVTCGERAATRNSTRNRGDATCGLILRAKFLDPHKPRCGIAGLLPAHSLFIRSKLDELKESPEKHDMIQKMRNEVLKRQDDTSYTLQWEKLGHKRTDLDLGKAMLAYRVNKQPDSNQPNHPYSQFMNDVILMEIKNKGADVTDRNINDAMMYTEGRGEQTIRLGQIIPIKNEETLKDWSKKRIAVKVGSTSGWLIPAGMSLKERKTLLHLRLALKEKQEKGDSGSIVHVMDTDDKHYYRLGMLRAVTNDEPTEHKSYVHIATVLFPSIADIKHRYRELIDEVMMAGDPIVAIPDCSKLGEKVKTKSVSTLAPRQGEREATDQPAMRTDQVQATANAESRSFDPLPLSSDPPLTLQTGVLDEKQREYLSIDSGYNSRPLQHQHSISEDLDDSFLEG